ncbi:MAG: transposase [bacterium]
MTQVYGRASSDLTDEEWHTVMPLMPPPKHTGRPRAPDRQVLDAIFFVLHTGCQWKELPRERYGAYSTAANRLRHWQANGTWPKIQTALLLLLLRKQQINLTSCYLDGALIASKRGEDQPSETMLSDE